MKTCNAKLASGVLCLAVQSALATMAAMACMPLLAQAETTVPSATETKLVASDAVAATSDSAETAAIAGVEDPAVTALIRPTNYIELGAVNVSSSSAKFGEYNGLNTSGVTAVGNVNIRGGNAYDGGDGIRRWGVTGTDLGTTSREFGATIADQGKWNLGFRFDELYHAIADTYQTPYLGAMGGNVFTLPSNFGAINTAAVASPYTQNVQNIGTRNMTAAQIADFNAVDVGTTRKNSAFAAGYNFDQHWTLQFDYNRLNQSGAKLISAGSSNAASWANQAMVTLMNPTDYQTDTFNLALNWMGEKGYFTASYYGSLFSDANNGLYWQNPMYKGATTSSAAPAGGYQQDMLSTAPSNVFHQLNATGGYAFTSTTKIAGGLSYGRTIQDQAYNVDSSVMQAGGLPVTSLNGLIITNNANVKITDQSIKNLSLSAGFKYNERLNLTGSDVYKMIDIGGLNRLEINTPYSNSKTEFELAGDYRLTSAQNVRLAYNHENIERWCENIAGAVAVAPGVGTSPAGANCAIVPSSSEEKFSVNYRYKVTGDLTTNATYTYAKRTSVVDNNAITPLNNQIANNSTGYVNAANYLGFSSYFDASRIQNQTKLSANWQATDRLSLSLSGRYSTDDYFDSALGEQSGHSASVNLDSTFAYTEMGSVSAYATIQNREMYALSGASGNGATVNSNNLTGGAAGLVAPTNIYSNQLIDKDQTIGLNLKQKGLMDGKLEVTADASLSIGKTGYTTEIPYYVATAAAPTCTSAASLACGSTPLITNRTLQFKLAGLYQINHHSKVVLRYMFQKEASNDYYYNVYQTGYTSSTMLPTNQLAPNYVVNAVSATYVYSF